jgi:hypothetical protein
MVVAGICVVLLLFGVCYHRSDRDRPLDEGELRVLRRLADRIRAEQHIFD